MNRRFFLKLLSTGIIGHTLDVDKLLWVPGQKTIFLPSTTPDFLPMSMSQIVTIEWERVVPKIREHFEQDAHLYKYLMRADIVNSKTDT